MMIHSTFLMILVTSTLIFPFLGVGCYPTHIGNGDELKDCDILKDCSMEYWDPWCGTNGRTYSSRCSMENAMCDGPDGGVKIKHKGSCRHCFVYCR